MTRTLVRAILILAIVGCLSSAEVQAAPAAQHEAAPTVGVPRLIPINGLLTDQSRRPLGGVVGVTFGLYRDQFGGAPLWLESHNIELNAAGGYTAFLGATAAEGLPMELFTSGEARWLGVRAQVFLAEEQPRVLLVSVPYALKAGDADTIGGKPASAFVLAQPDGQSNSKSQPESRSIQGSDEPDVFAVQGTGTANRLSKWLETGGAGTLGDSNVVETDGGTNFRFGTSSGGSRLSATGGISAGIWMRYLDQNMYVDSDLNSIFRVNGSSILSEAMRITNGGNVGIGTSAPAGTLDVRGTNSWFGTSAGGSRLNATGGSSAGIWMRFVDQNMYLDSDFSTLFRVNGISSVSEAMRITSAGRVGIGTPAPEGTLDVRGTNSWFGTSAGGSRLNATGGSAAGIWMRFVDKNMYLDSDFSTLFRVNGSASVSEAMRITNAGNVGIGTSSPTAKFEVAGNLKISGSGNSIAFPDGSILKSASRGITYLAGCDTCGVLLDTDDQPTIYVNVMGSVLTINSVACFPNAGTPSINIKRDNGDGTPENILSTPLVCNPSGGVLPAIVLGERVLNPNDKLDFEIVTAGGTAKRVTVAINATLN